MKKGLSTILVSVLVIGSALTAGENSVQISDSAMTPGMKVYKKKMRKGCRSTGLRFTKSHTQSEWKAIYAQGKLPQEAKSLCPKLDTSRLTSSDWDKIYTFVNNHSSDNLILPEC